MTTRRAVVVLSALMLLLVACSDDSSNADVEAAEVDAPSAAEAANDEPGPGGEGDAEQDEPAEDTAALLIGRWLGPEPGMNQAECENGTTEYGFESDGTWLGRNVNIDECGGTFTVGGTYTLSDDGRSVVLRFTSCPVSCSEFPDATVSITFDGRDRLTMSDSSFTGTYHRQ